MTSLVECEWPKPIMNITSAEDEISLQDYILLHNRIVGMSGSKPA